MNAANPHPSRSMKEADAPPVLLPEIEAEEHWTEIAYQKRQNKQILFAFAPAMILYTLFSYHYDFHFLALLFFLQFLNAVAGFLISLRLETVEQLIKLKKISGSIPFILLGVILIYGMLAVDLYIFMPWIFFFPVAIMLFLGKRLGFLGALIFCGVCSAVIVTISPPALIAETEAMLKINTVATLLALLLILGISEKARLKTQKELVVAKNKYKLAEQRQSQINAELQAEIKRRVASEKALAQGEIRYRALFEESPISLGEENWSGVKNYLDGLSDEIRENLYEYLINDAEALNRCIKLVRITGFNRATLELFETDTIQKVLEHFRKVVSSTQAVEFMAHRIFSLYTSGRYETELSGLTLNGRPLRLLITNAIPAGFETSWERIFTSIYDMTERFEIEEEKKRVDKQLEHIHKMQAIATLAGGIAHQFNNALSVIFGSIDLMELDAKKHAENLIFIEPLKKSAGSMRRLTAQLLAYAQGGKYQPTQFSFNDLIRELLYLQKIEHAPSIRILTELKPDLLLTIGDITQIKMVIEAVLTNAFEAITDDGQVTVKTYNQKIETNTAFREFTISPGDYAVVSVTDTGVGMDAETQRRIFEPFFTTKFHGRGLGLPAAFGIIRNHEGMIAVQSAPEVGSTVSIYLPKIKS